MLVIFKILSISLYIQTEEEREIKGEREIENINERTCWLPPAASLLKYLQ